MFVLESLTLLSNFSILLRCDYDFVILLTKIVSDSVHDKATKVEPLNCYSVGFSSYKIY